MYVKPSRRLQAGVGLVELMVGAAVGLVVIGGAAALYLNSSRSGNDSQRQTRLTQEVRAVMDVLVQDVRRSGYWASALAGGANPFTVRTSGSATDLFVSAGCLLYTYDATFIGGTNPGVVDAADYFGFRRNGTAIQMLNQGSGLSDTSVDCTATTSGWWQNLTDPSSTTITDFSISTTYKCLSATNVASQSTAPCTASGDVETRQLTLSITAQHARDAALRITLAETILLPNNRLVP